KCDLSSLMGCPANSGGRGWIDLSPDLSDIVRARWPRTDARTPWRHETRTQMARVLGQKLLPIKDKAPIHQSCKFVNGPLDKSPSFDSNQKRFGEMRHILPMKVMGTRTEARHGARRSRERVRKFSFNQGTSSVAPQTPLSPAPTPPPPP